MLPLSGSVIIFCFNSARFDAFKLIHLISDGFYSFFVGQIYGHKTIFTQIELVWFSFRTRAKRSTGLPSFNAAILDITPPSYTARKCTLRHQQPQQQVPYN